MKGVETGEAVTDGQPDNRYHKQLFELGLSVVWQISNPISKLFERSVDRFDTLMQLTLDVIVEAKIRRQKRLDRAAEGREYINALATDILGRLADHYLGAAEGANENKDIDGAEPEAEPAN